MNKTQGIEIAEQLRNRGFTLSGWARANRFKLRTVNDFLYAGLARMAPDDAPTGIPSNPALRKQFYRWIALSRPAAAGDLSSGLDCRRLPTGKTTSNAYFDHLGKDPVQESPPY
jgi:hypothetical protein